MNKSSEILCRYSGQNAQAAGLTEHQAPAALSDKELTHKRNKENVLIANPRREEGVLTCGFRYQYVTDMIVNQSHSFFFEHERGHIPALMLIEAARQSSLALVHKFLEIPLSKEFIMHNINCDFPSYASLHFPIKIFMSMDNDELSSRSKRRIPLDSRAVQCGRIILNASGNCSIVSKRIVRKMEEVVNRGEVVS